MATGLAVTIATNGLGVPVVNAPNGMPVVISTMGMPVVIATNGFGVPMAGLAVGPVNTVAPAITGTPGVGNVLTCSTGTWTGAAPITYTYQWLRDGSPISGATASTYTFAVPDQTKAISCRVTATNAQGSANALSNIVSDVTQRYLLNKDNAYIINNDTSYLTST